MLNDLRVAISFLTILPLGMPNTTQVGRSFAWYPLVGVMIGGGCDGYRHATHKRTNSRMVGGSGMGDPNGGLHLDGFGDTCDGMFASVPLERRREIMKDPRTGTWAVVGLILLLLGKLVGLQALRSPWLWVLPPLMGRWAMVLAVQFFPSNSTGLGAYFRTGFLPRHTVFATVCMVAGLGVVTALTGPAVWVVLPLTLGLTLGIGRMAQRRLGGLNGDVYGFLCEVVELVAVYALGSVNG
ncbi:MAG UNVERIFIED_CONTAM: adenosylcobinamide-GDP ribazoletransferase [Anaerolineae bacterium]|jgi:adenosylcobinamide-GDP ribazoletransferase